MGETRSADPLSLDTTVPLWLRKRAASALRLVWLSLVVSLTPPLAAVSADWPQWRFDANRSGATAEAGPAQGRLLWRLDLDRPDPAFDHQYRMCADVTYAPIAAEGRVFLPSNVADQVLACDLETGEVQWRFAAAGPVRFAPVYRAGKVYFGSDDGYLYCVSAGQGELLWRVRGAPETLPDSRMLVNGRLGSRWPVRGAPVEHQGAVYFGAGIWPEEGVYVCAVDAETGRLRWRKDSLSYIRNGMSDHGRAYDLSLPPQGYLALIDGRLAVPSGRSLAAWFDPADGRMEPYTCFYVKTNPPRGTWYATGIGRWCVQGGNWFGTRADAAPHVSADLQGAVSALAWSRETPENEQYVIRNRPFLRADTYRLHNENWYTEPVLTETAMYAAEFVDESKYLVPRGHTRIAFPEFDRIVARDLTRPHWTTTRQRRVAAGGGVAVDMLRLEFPVLWELASPLRVLLKAADQLYAGGRDAIAAIAIPDPGETPHIAWQASLVGTPVHALVADGKLVVVTETGSVYCFGSAGDRRASADNELAAAPSAPPAPESVADSATSAAVPPAYASPPSGYACLLGWHDGTRAKTLAREGGYRVLVFEPDADRAAQAKADLLAAGLYGRQVQLVPADLDQVRLAPYWANLIVAESLDRAGPPEAILAAALDCLRPYSGQLVLPAGHVHAGIIERLLASRSGYAQQQDAAGLTVRRTSPPAGADDWSHESGGSANGFANSERLVKWPLGVLWYSGDIDRYFTPASHFQHERQPYPLVAGGRMFLITGQHLHAIDIYTGGYLWRAEMPLTPWVQTRLFDSRIYGRPTERNYVAAADRVYAVIGEQIYVYDAATGRQVNVFEIPPPFRDGTPVSPTVEEQAMGVRAQVQAAPAWTEVRLWKDLLLALLGPNLVAVDRHTGAVRWSRASTRQTSTYAAGADRLFGLDCDVPPLGGGADRGELSGLLFALNPQSGEVAWQTTPEYAAVPKHAVDNPRLWLRPLIPVVSHNAKHGLIVVTVNGNQVHAFRDADGSPVWTKQGLARGNLQLIYPPVVTDDYLVLSGFNGCFGYLLDVQTGQEAGANTGIPRPRTCARILGNNDLLVYRDAATELYDIAGNRMIGLNSLRSGCTTSFIPAGGVMTAPMLGHGCVCNYPMFASLGLFHCPEIEPSRPAAVAGSWVNQAEPLLAAAAVQANAPAAASAPLGAPADTMLDLQKYRLLNCTLKPAGGRLQLSTKDDQPGYAVRQADQPWEKASLTFAVQRAEGAKRHGNAFFVCGPSDQPGDWIECRLYYGGRRSLMIAGRCVEQVEAKVALPGQGPYQASVTVDCQARTVSFAVGSQVVTTKLTGAIKAITHYGYGGANSDSVFTEVVIR
ncbi:MAG: PQQ-binding-like beta-propeller repeat protein [Pirellulaceae bacterium]|nr:PQQ-binding-like beta-propeller repeat protein [Pirellulaceae bacterium]